MDNNEIIRRLKETKLFCSLSDEDAAALLTSSSVSSLSSGDDAWGLAKGHMALVLKGSADVYSADAGSKAVLRRLEPGDLFGVSALFSGNAPASKVITHSRTLLLLIPKEAVSNLIHRNASFAGEYIAFLEKKIAFLSKRISSFTAGSCEKRLASYLISASEENEFSVNVSFSSLAKQLDMGRASFYRALAILEETGYVRHDEKMIFVTDRTSLKEKYE